MKADERIEKLLNSFGQTIDDLPIVYESQHFLPAQNAMYDWLESREGKYFVKDWNNDAQWNYICHLADVIDRMEAALETARWYAWMMSSSYMPDITKQDCPEYWRIHDRYLTGMPGYKEEDYDE